MCFQNVGRKKRFVPRLKISMIKNRFHNLEKRLGEVNEFSKTLNFLNKEFFKTRNFIEGEIPMFCGFKEK